MGLGLRLIHRLEHRLDHRLRLTRGVISVESGCPECGHTLTNAEIRSGWTDNPVDFTTLCPKCNNRFVCKLVFDPEDTDGELVKVDYLCAIQLEHKIKNIYKTRTNLGILFLRKNYPDVLYNMIKYHGTYEKALKEFKKGEG